MKVTLHSLNLFFILLVGMPLSTFSTSAEKAHPDTVKTGIYITSIHDIDFKQKEYSIIFWLWLTHKNPDFNFAKYLEIPQAKTVTTLYSSIDTSEKDKVQVLLKLQCLMKDSWKIDNFPFNRQNLRLTIENAQFDKSELVFSKDTAGQIYDAHALTGYGIDSLKGWHIVKDSVKVSIGTKEYETNFGDESIAKPHTVYSAYKIKIGISRDSWGLFWKIFLGMYVSFLIAYATFHIHSDNTDSRFGLAVGALFAVIGNKYIIESSLPESSSFTLVDTLHGLTLFFIISVIASTAYALHLRKKINAEKANRFDRNCGTALLTIYLILNIYFIAVAAKG